MSFGRFDHSQGTAPMSDINMTPLIDVMLVLVVIFIMTAPLLASSVKLDLPKTGATAAGNVSESMAVTVDAFGQVYIADQPVSLVELNRRLMASAKANPDTEVQLRADKTVPYGRIVEVMGAAQQAGLNRIGFVTDSNTPALPSAGTVAP
jgi:biopolymer transport protein TolR